MIIYGHADRTARYLILGEAPNRALEGREHMCWIPCGSRKRHSANRLRDLLGIQGVGEWLRTFDRSNVFDEVQPRSGKGDFFSVARGRRELLTQWPMLVSRGYQGILVMGSRVSSALSWRDEQDTVLSAARLPVLEWRSAIPHRSVCQGLGEHTRIRAAVVPHPSGVNRWYNEPENKRRAEAFLRSLDIPNSTS